MSDDGIVQSGREVGDAAAFLFETAGPGGYSGRHVDVGGRVLLNFASYDYLGLARRSELADAAIVAARRHGTQFPFPPVMLETELYGELRLLLEEMTGGHVVVAPSTTLGHMAALPALVERGDAVIVEENAHPSLHRALALLPAVPVESLPGDCTSAEMEVRVRLASARFRRVWYVLDGVDPLHGRLADVEMLSLLLRRYPSLHLYVDDAHGTSWTGARGRGHALEGITERDRVVAALSLNKAFSAAGAALVLADREAARRVARANAMLLSAAIAPPMLGAAVASARLHLSSELVVLQGKLMDRIRWAIRSATTHGVALADTTESPLFFVPCRDALATGRFLRDRGIYGGVVGPPLVAAKRAGVRFMVSAHNEMADIEHLMATLAEASRRCAPARA
jgi:7-keto-8-aminopelargonate synthetase-like enzyme